ncbi:MAG: peptide ABC transporter substrate-binding protein [Chloroflexi bacterium]|nr:peptide ABC transporter substrate-binding protein [Chloroflexota bacterium]
MLYRRLAPCAIALLLAACLPATTPTGQILTLSTRAPTATLVPTPPPPPAPPPPPPPPPPPAPECAAAWDGGPLQMDQLSVAFRLLPGIQWSDGTALTAADSVFSYRIARDCDAGRGQCGGNGLVPYSQETVKGTARYVALDSLTTLWVGLPGFLDSHYRTNFFIPLPEHQLGRYSAAELFDAEESARTPPGWGPYFIRQWTPGQRIVAERNPHYFRAGEGLPYFDRVIFRFTGEGAEQNLAALQAGTCDVLNLETHLDAGLEALLALEQEGALKLYANVGTVWEHLDFGLNPAPDYRRPDFFADVRTRRAIAGCIDRRRIVDELFHGLTLIPKGYLSPLHPLAPLTNLTRYPFDPAASAILLEQAGWRDADGDGLREAHGVAGIPDGTPLRLNYATTTSQTRGQVAGLIAENLASCGIALTVSQTGPAEFFGETADGPVFGQKFDLAQFAWLTGVTPPCELYLSTAIPSQASDWQGNNNTGYASPAFDAACRSALAALPGTDLYRTNHLEALRIFSEDLPVLPLYLRFNLSASRPDLQGLIVDSTLMAETWNIEEFRLEP